MPDPSARYPKKAFKINNLAHPDNIRTIQRAN